MSLFDVDYLPFGPKLPTTLATDSQVGDHRLGFDYYLVEIRGPNFGVQSSLCCAITCAWF